MSDNQEEFEALSKAARSFVNAQGKDAERLRGFCEGFMRNWRETRGPNGNDDHRLINDVFRWTMNRYNIPRYKPKRSREQRARDFLATPVAFQFSGEDFGRASVRNTARITGQSKSTVARHLARQGIAPRRDAKIRKLSKTAQQLIRILDATFDSKAEGILQLERLAMALWDDGSPRHVPVTTQASRKKKLATLLSEISGAGVGYNIFTIGAVCGIRRGRRFPSLSEANTWIAEALRLGRYPAIQLPKPVAVAEHNYFWADPIVVDVMSIIDMSVSGHFYPVKKLEAIFRMERLLFDMTPVLPWIERAYHSFAGDDMAGNLADLTEKINDPGVKKATRRLAKIMHDLRSFIGGFPSCYDAFQMADYVLGFMDKTAETSPESFARLAYIRDWFEASGDDYLDGRDHLLQMLELEKAGEWQTPDAATLAQYLPVTGSPEMENESLVDIYQLNQMHN
ncbi:hypothetical protein AGRHK599_LOCUS280 [Rhizobium rhizogenes]|uniref:Uncharacterized protein n=1 Tax=Rhizobium rhizogenes TaxID=359 RepID=A0AAN2A1W2_RHIRH|nr:MULTISPECIES: hypothetical protein [Rhizobium/Agrobacterium group]AQS62596.1 hypothetical protein B0909_10425 [Rhizobium rhizogenes]MCZ7441735.1 hypothetical protein [Rhizobium rhizogenes]NSZ78055.1 hypothetical protein [Agrobacterium tumefaciens]OAM64938.1 hypothetical protein A8L48_17880 [Rhizobium rhizogenes]CAD0210265.1 hypothetical protein AGRHK599_LOCUS280 [Rhizobium rhizogenes]